MPFATVSMKSLSDKVSSIARGLQLKKNFTAVMNL